jgi:hypothetical protein
VHPHHVHRLARLAGAVAVPHLDLPPALQIAARAPAQLRVELDRDHAPARAHDLGQDRAVVADRAADVRDALALADRERVEEPRQEAGGAVVQHARRIDRRGHVLVEPARIGVGRGAIARLVGEQEPGPGAEELLARHGCERRHDARRCDAALLAEPLRERRSHPGEIRHASRSRSNAA